MQLLARPCTPRRASGDGAVQPDPRGTRVDGSRAGMAGICGPSARCRRAHQLRRTPQALVLPDPERRPARVRARRDRDDRASRALPSPPDAQAASRGVRGASARAAEDRPDARGDVAACREPRSQSFSDDYRPRAAQSRRRCPAAAADVRRRRARAVGGRTERCAIRARDRTAAADGSEQTDPC